MNPVYFILGVPAVSAIALAIMPSYRLAAKVNVGATFLTLIAGLVPFAHRPETIRASDRAVSLVNGEIAGDALTARNVRALN